MKRLFQLATTLAVPVGLAAAVAAPAQFNPPQFLKAAPAAPKSVQAGKPFTVSVAVTVDPPYHIQGNPSKDGYIATEMEVGPLKGFKVGKISYPKPVETSSNGERLPVYTGKISIKAEVTPDRAVKPGKYMLPIALKYQGCDAQKCFPPATLNTKAAFSVAAGAKPR